MSRKNKSSAPSQSPLFELIVYRTRKPTDAGQGTRLATVDADGIMRPIRQPGESDEQWQNALEEVEKQREAAASFRLDRVATYGDLLRYCRTLLEVMERDAQQATVQQTADTLVRAIWRRLDHLKWSHLAPEEPEQIRNLTHARRAIRTIMKWCHENGGTAELQGDRWQTLRRRLQELFPKRRTLDRDLYFHRLAQEYGLGPAEIRDRCRKDHPEWKLSEGTAGREVVAIALRRMAAALQKSGLSA